MFAKRLIQLLSICLIGVVGLFLYSEYGAKAPESVVETVSPERTETPSSKAEADESTEVAKAETVEQPDKSLPIPAHQLKKVIAESEKLEQDDLQAKIEAANQAIAKIDQQLGGQSPEQAQKTSAQADDDLQKRIDHIKAHLEKNKQ